ncbi:MAG: DUF1846 domain-containing protein [Bacilli bacterium]|nr:DUF1846 domain-containing protein [Bacilli bacterium]
MKKAFSNELYVELQSKHIQERINQFDNKLYLEFGGKLFDDYHASRVLPGFKPNSKLMMLLTLKDKVEIIFAVCAKDLEKQKTRGDLGITYDVEVMRLIEEYRRVGLYVGSVTITQYENQNAADTFKKQLELSGIPVFLQYPIPGYPNNIDLIISDEGFGKNDYIKTSRPLVVVTAPGPGSGKMATCLSQLYLEHKHGIRAGYAKFETFPIWNIPLKHPVNLAYEAATVDLNDVNMIDPFHLEKYNKTTINYNRDIEIFPVLNAMFTRIFGESPYHSPTDMGVNMAGYAIIDDEAAKDASCREIVRRYYHTQVDYLKGKIDEKSLTKMEMLLSQAGVSVKNRKCAVYANQLAEELKGPVCAIELNDGTLIRGKTSHLLKCSSSAMLNALKYLAGIDKEEKLLSPDMLESIRAYKNNILKDEYPLLDTHEVLLTLSIASRTDENAKKALEVINQLADCEVHSTVVLSKEDNKVFRKLKMNLTCDPKQA